MWIWGSVFGLGLGLGEEYSVATKTSEHKRRSNLNRLENVTSCVAKASDDFIVT